jgi:integrase
VPNSAREKVAARCLTIRKYGPSDAAHVAALLAALSRVEDRALWATAMFVGLRRGELMALRWEDVDLGACVLHVKRSFDIEGGEFQGPKSKSGVRTVPIVGVLAPYLRDHLMRCGRREGLVFGREGIDGGLVPFNASSMAWR